MSHNIYLNFNKINHICGKNYMGYFERVLSAHSISFALSPTMYKVLRSILYFCWACKIRPGFGFLHKQLSTWFWSVVFWVNALVVQIFIRWNPVCFLYPIITFFIIRISRECGWDFYKSFLQISNFSYFNSNSW